MSVIAHAHNHPQIMLARPNVDPKSHASHIVTQLLSSPHNHLNHECAVPPPRPQVTPTTTNNPRRPQHQPPNDSINACKKDSDRQMTVSVQQTSMRRMSATAQQRRKQQQRPQQLSNDDQRPPAKTTGTPRPQSHEQCNGRAGPCHIRRRGSVSEAKGRTTMVPTGPGHGFTRAGDYDWTEQKEV